jgi:hypothetical protein
MAGGVRTSGVKHGAANWTSCLASISIAASSRFRSCTCSFREFSTSGTCQSIKVPSMVNAL